jgi:hypothetical protein
MTAIPPACFAVFGNSDSGVNDSNGERESELHGAYNECGFRAGPSLILNLPGHVSRVNRSMEGFPRTRRVKPARSLSWGSELVRFMPEGVVQFGPGPEAGGQKRGGRRPWVRRAVRFARRILAKSESLGLILYSQSCGGTVLEQIIVEPQTDPLTLGASPAGGEARLTVLQF